MAMGPGNTAEMSNESCTRLLGEVSACVEETIRSCGAKQVHDLRVAIRRLNQALRTFESCFPQNAVKKITKRLKKTMSVAGRVRNLDVAMQYAMKWRLTDQPGLQRQRDDAARDLTNALAKWDLQLRTCAPEVAVVPVQDHARELLSAMASSFFGRGNEAAAHNARTHRLHGFRIAAKKFRYAMELFAPCYGPMLEARIEQVRELQTVLGDINDCATLRGILSGDSAATRLRKKQRRKMEEFRGQWMSQFSGAAILREWVEALALLSVRKGPQREHVYRRVVRTASTFGEGRRRSFR